MSFVLTGLISSRRRLLFSFIHVLQTSIAFLINVRISLCISFEFETIYTSRLLFSFLESVQYITYHVHFIVRTPCAGQPMLCCFS